MIGTLYALSANAHEKVVSHEHTKEVLILNSYHKGFEWTDSTVKGIEDTFKNAGMKINISYEYFDTKRHRSDMVNSYLYELFRQKYNYPIDVIISTDNSALSFLLEYEDSLFLGSPVVFSGVSLFEDATVNGRSHITGVMENVDIESTIDMMLDLHEGLENILIISDFSDYGLTQLNSFQQVRHKFDNHVNFVEMVGWTKETIKKAMSEENEKTAVLLLSAGESYDGEKLSTVEGLEAVTVNKNVPVYSLWDFNIRKGVVGGVVASGYSQGKQAGELAIKILNGADPQSLAIIRSGFNVPMFDYERLHYFGIHRNDVADGSVIINEPESFYYKHKKSIWIFMSIILVQTIAIIAFVFTITIRRKYNAVLKRNEFRLAHHLNNTPLASIVWNTDLEIIEWNSAAEKVFGYTEKEVLGKKGLPLLYSPHDKNTAKSSCDNILDKIESTSELCMNITKGGATIFCEWYDTPLVDIDGNVTGIASLVQDITEKRTAEKSAKINYERFHDFASASSDWFWEMDEQFHFTYISSSQKREEGPYFTPGDVWHEDKDVDIVNDPGCKYMYECMLKKEPFREVEYSMPAVDFDGTQYLSSSAMPIYDSYGEFKGFRGSTTDITEQKLAKEKQEELSNRFMNAIENLSEGVALWDKNEKFVLCNSRYYEIVGSTQPIPVGTELKDYLSEVVARGELDLGGRTPKDWIKWRLDHFREGSLEPLELLNRGKWFHIQEHATSEGDRVVIFRDVTEQKELTLHKNEMEARLARSQKLEHLGSLVAGISHEFNNKLVPILGLSDLTAKAIPDDNPAKENLTIMHTAAQQATQLVRKLLKLGDSPMGSAPLIDNLNIVIEESMQLLRAAMGRKCYLKEEIEKELPSIACTEEDFQHIMMNLCINARDAIYKEKGNVAVSIKRKRLKKNNSQRLVAGEYVAITVSDDGCGMDEETQKRIFDPFFSTKDRTQGSGLGLSIVYSLVQRAGGEILIKTQKNKGTSVDIYLPSVHDSKVYKEESGLKESLNG